jgi:hypothetical protein
MSINVYPTPPITISGTVKTEDQKQEGLFHELARELKIIRQHNEIMTGVEFDQEQKD